MLDVRTPAEFGEIHVEYARNAPLESLNPQKVMAQRNGQASAPLYLICKAGSRSAKACEQFIAQGFSNVISISGGTQACEQAGLPVVRGRKAISLDRQMRIVAGSLILIGAALGWLVHPGFFGLCAFIGAGLVFAGVTDVCPMAMMIARMPWNQVGGGSAACHAQPVSRSGCCGS